jgi:hypothetical protein
MNERRVTGITGDAPPATSEDAARQSLIDSCLAFNAAGLTTT